MAVPHINFMLQISFKASLLLISLLVIYIYLFCTPQNFKVIGDAWKYNVILGFLLCYSAQW